MSRLEQITFVLAYGSPVRYQPTTGLWQPESLLVNDPRDILAYRALIQVVAALPNPLRHDYVQAAFQVGAQLKTVQSAPKAAPNEMRLPPPLKRPDAPPQGSLAGFLKQTPAAREAIRAALRPSLPSPPDGPLRCPPLGANAGLVGTAFDTALRFLVHGLNPQLLTVTGFTVARLAAFDLERHVVMALVNEAEASLADLVQGNPLTAQHARAAVVLASLEVVVGTGRFQELVGVVPDAAWRDVLALLEAVPPTLFQAQRQVVIGPTFSAAERIGGADADLLLDQRLVEVKATRHLTLQSSYVQQLVTYLVLERLGGITGSREPVRELAVYFARYGLMQVFHIRELFRPGGLPLLVGWFDQSLTR